MHWAIQKIQNIALLAKSYLLNRKSYENQSIPKDVHFIWLGNALPEKYKKNILSWIQNNPEYNMHLWIDSASITNNTVNIALKSISTFCSDNSIYVHDIAIMPQFSEFVILPWYNDWLHGADKTLAFAADTLRIEILLRYGGIYSDLDMLCKKPLPELQSEHGFVGWKFSDKFPNEMFDDNCFIAAIAGHPVLATCKEEIALHYQKFLLSGADYLDVHRGIDVVHTRFSDERLAQLKDPSAQRHIMNASYDNYRLSDGSTFYTKSRFVGGVVTILAIEGKFKELYGNENAAHSIFRPADILEHQRHNSWGPRGSGNLKGILGVTRQGGLAHIDCNECLTLDEIKEIINTSSDLNVKNNLRGVVACKY